MWLAMITEGVSGRPFSLYRLYQLTLDLDFLHMYGSMTIARPGVKVTVIGEGQGSG